MQNVIDFAISGILGKVMNFVCCVEKNGMSGFFRNKKDVFLQKKSSNLQGWIGNDFGGAFPESQEECKVDRMFRLPLPSLIEKEEPKDVPKRFREREKKKKG